jgi:hypothetical protein
LKGKAAFDLLRKLAGSSREVLAETSWRGESVVCRVWGAFSATTEAFTVNCAGSLVFDANSIDISSCEFEERLSTSPTPQEGAADIEIGVPFARLRLDDGTRITFSRVPS